MRVKTEARRLAYIRAAGKLFTSRGYGEVSMEAIAAEVGGSKVTLYNYFGGKEELFEAFVIDVGRDKQDALLETQRKGESVRGALLRLGMSFMTLVTSPTVVAVDSVILAEGRRFPALCRIYYENGPKRTMSALAKVMQALMDSGAIRVSDPHIAALHFKGLCEADIRDHQVWGLTARPTKSRLKKAVEDGVNAFLLGYQTLSPTKPGTTKIRRHGRPTENREL